MRNGRLKKLTVRSSTSTRINRLRVRWAGLIVAVLMGTALLAVAVRAYNHATLNPVIPTKATAPRLLQGNSAVQRGAPYARLSLQPEADKLRRRLGQRFLAPGRERTAIVGSLTIGGQQLPVLIVRTQNDDGENVEIGLNGGPASLTWSAIEGAKSGGGLPNSSERLLIERLALDSPDQFIQAQLRGASYYTVARSAMPAEANGVDDYAGPVWDLVRIGEPSGAGANRPVSLSRLYYINSSTGLIDKIAYQEQGDTVIAELSDWTNQAGELEPRRIIWKRNNQIVLQLTVANISHTAR